MSFILFFFSKERGTDGYLNHIIYSNMLMIRYSILKGFKFIEDYAIDLFKKRIELAQHIVKRYY